MAVKLYKDDLDKALVLADAADTITTKYYLSSKLSVTTKPDTSPVTQADTETESALRHIVHTTFMDAYLGEEGARSDSNNDRLWIVDPIDGTKNFMRGMPIWATLIALRDSSGPLVAVVSAPALGRRWWAARGEGAFTSDTNGKKRRLRVSKIQKLEDAYIGHGSLFAWDDLPQVGAETFIGVLRNAWRHRGIGDFLSYMMVAEGAMDACMEPTLKQWDIEAPNLIIKEAGGSVWSNVTATTPPEAPRAVVGSNGLLETVLLKQLGLGSPRP